MFDNFREESPAQSLSPWESSWGKYNFTPFLEFSHILLNTLMCSLKSSYVDLNTYLFVEILQMLHYAYPWILITLIIFPILRRFLGSWVRKRMGGSGWNVSTRRKRWDIHISYDNIKNIVEYEMTCDGVCVFQGYVPASYTSLPTTTKLWHASYVQDDTCQCDMPDRPDARWDMTCIICKMARFQIHDMPVLYGDMKEFILRSDSATATAEIV